MSGDLGNLREDAENAFAGGDNDPSDNLISHHALAVVIVLVILAFYGIASKVITGANATRNNARMHAMKGR
jgi:hypothetical protein